MIGDVAVQPLRRQRAFDRLRRRPYRAAAVLLLHMLVLEPYALAPLLLDPFDFAPLILALAPLCLAPI